MIGALFHLMLHLPFIKRLSADRPEAVVEETYEDGNISEPVE